MPAGTQPKYRLVQPKIAIMERKISDLDMVVEKLVSYTRCPSASKEIISSA